ncbi:MAG: membrane protein insertion efficiency factor YidD [SAR86 cluster bacterium]|jgi:putative membrane protein insertion efficiency factor|nr:membrane protein insertion efficiency factor YidD [SAR86 cluster bacterium]|tara:strand:+ start:332 stop:568 length:237 start_codon:yes stop_codon:yes gene_type:complete
MVKKVFIKIIKIYQKTISPLLGQNCRYHPTCSQYAIEALTLHGVFYGSFLAIKRIIKCNPWGGSGIDNVPNGERHGCD